MSQLSPFKVGAALLLSLVSTVAQFSWAEVADSNNESAPAVREILVQMADALRNKDYKALLTYKNNDQNISLQIVHKVENGLEHERLMAIDGGSHEIVRKGKAVDCLQQGERIFRGYLTSALAEDIVELDDFYQFTLTENGQVSGRSAYLVTIKPRDQYRFGYEFAVDKETKLMLQAKLVTLDDKVMEQFKVVDLQVGQVNANDLKPMTSDAKILTGESCEKVEKPETELHAKAPWTFDLPNGFKMCSYDKSKAMQGDAMVFSDGLSTFSVFVNNQHSNKVSIQRGSTHLSSQPVTLKNLPLMVTVVGEVPEVTAQRIIQSISHSEP